MNPLPAWAISILFFFGGALALYSAWRYKDWTGMIFSPILLAFAIMYFHYYSFPVDIYVRQVQVRIGLASIGVVILLWRIGELWVQVKSNGK